MKKRLNVGLAFHGGIRASQRMHGRFGSFIAVHTLAFPLECMVALTGYIYSGAPEQFPKLRIAALEASCGWVPFLMDRMDEEFEIRGKREAPLLKRKPSEVLTSGQFYCAFELEETTLPYVAERIGSDKLLYSSDYPHWDTSWPHSVRAVTKRGDLTDSHKKRFLSENAQFAEIVVSHDIIWVGPKPEHIRTMGDKIEAKRTAAKLGLPLVPGSDGPIVTVDQAKKLAAEIGYPVLIKAASGGGGRGSTA